MRSNITSDACVRASVNSAITRIVSGSALLAKSTRGSSLEEQFDPSQRGEYADGGQRPREPHHRGMAMSAQPVREDGIAADNRSLGGDPESRVYAQQRAHDGGVLLANSEGRHANQCYQWIPHEMGKHQCAKS